MHLPVLKSSSMCFYLRTNMTSCELVYLLDHCLYFSVGTVLPGFLLMSVSNVKWLHTLLWVCKSHYLYFGVGVLLLLCSCSVCEFVCVCVRVLGSRTFLCNCWFPLKGLGNFLDYCFFLIDSTIK